MSWFEDSVLYQIYPLGLTGAPYENDGTSQPVARLRKIVDDGWVEQMGRLHVSGLILNPVFESLTHGYDTTDYTQVDRRLGTADDLRYVVDACHEAGIRVIMDTVFNHVGRSFWAFQDVREHHGGSPYAGWFNIDWAGNNDYGDGFSYECWQGVPYLAKLNHDSFELNEYLAGVVRGWVRDFGIDGLRMDVAYCLPQGFLRYLRGVCDDISRERGDKFLMLGETMFGDYNLWMGDDLCDTVTNYEVYKGLWSSFNSANMHEVAYALERQSGDKPWDLYTGRHLVDFADNHDVPRIATRLDQPAQLPALYGLLFGMPGVPCLYYGSEWGIEGEQKFGDHELRPALDAPEWNGLTDWLEHLAAARMASEALRHGDYHELQCQPTALAFQRAVEGERVIVAVNAADAPVTLHFDAGCGRAVDLITGEPHDFGGGSEVPARTCRFWRCER